MDTRVRAVRLRVNTDSGAYGRTIAFSPGMNVVRSANSRGKTQIVQAIIYALGLERMLSARANAPLGSVLTNEIRIPGGAGEHVLPVLTSWVAVELENENGDVLTVQRHVRHPLYARDLVRVWSGPAITDSEVAGPVEDNFLHAAGSASHDLGFHSRLAAFLGWHLPEVSTYSGQSIPLYLDVIFPFLTVDQQSWGSAAPRKVERYQIREPLRRAAEFLLALEGPFAHIRRDELEQTLTDLRLSWTAARSAIEAAASSVGGRVVGVPEQPAGTQARRVNVQATPLETAQLEVLDDGEWRAAEDVAEMVVQQLQAIMSASESVLLKDVGDETFRQLTEARAELADTLAAAHLIEQDLSIGEAQLAALDRRLEGLQEERARNADVRTLIRLGSETAAGHLADQNCPTCKQPLEGVESPELGPVLDVEDSIQLLNAQLGTARKMRDRVRTVVDQANSAYAAMQRQADQLRARVRAVEADSLAPVGTLSSSEVATRVILELRRDELERARTGFAERIESLTDIARRIAAIRAEINGLPEGLPENDAARIDEVTTQMQTHLLESGFGSYSVSEVQLDRDLLRPTRTGFDVDTDVSASDVVRIKVAYLESIRSIGRITGYHPGLLVLDEPRQQDIEPPHFGAMLRYLAAGSNVAGGQVIITSATSTEELRQLLGGAKVFLIDLGDDRVLQPVPTLDRMEARAKGAG